MCCVVGNKLLPLLAIFKPLAAVPVSRNHTRDVTRRWDAMLGPCGPFFGVTQAV